MSLALKQTQNHYTEDDYYKLGEDVHAELIDGQFYDMATPIRRHQALVSELNTAISTYIHSKKGPCKVYPGPFAVKLFDDEKTIVEPDISVICDPSKLTDKGCSGAPDWVIEIASPSNPGHDYIRKLNLYYNAGVREYWIVNPLTMQIHVYCLEADKFTPDSYTFDDTIKAGIYDDLYIDFSALDLT